MRKRKQKPYFERWYFREQTDRFSCVFVPTIFYDGEGRMTGTLDVKLLDSHWHLDFAHPVNMNLRGSIFLVLGKCVFTEACIHLDIDEPGLTIKGDIYFDGEFGNGRINHRWKIWAMEQTLSGELEVNGKKFSFDGGRGSLEARKKHIADTTSESFYSQCNWFGQRPLRIVCGGSERSCFAIINQDGYPIRLAAWKGAKMEYMSKDGFRIRQRRYVLEGWRTVERDPDGLEQTVRYRLTHNGDVLLDEISQRAAYEYV